MPNTLRPRLVLIVHESGEFLVRFNHRGTEAEALAFAVEQVGERWGFEVTEAHVATPEDVELNAGQETLLHDEV